MSDPTPRRRGRHASPDDDGRAGVPASSLIDALRRDPDEEPALGGGAPGDDDVTTRLPGLGAARPGPPPPPGVRPAGPADDRTAERDLWRALPGATADEHPTDRSIPPVPRSAEDDRVVDAPHGDGDHDGDDWDDEQHDEQHDEAAWHATDADETGGLEVFGADDHGHDDDYHDDYRDDGYHDDGYDDDGPRRPRRRRKPLTTVLSLVVLAGLVVGIVLGGKAIYGVINPTAEDYKGAGTGSVQVRVQNGDTLSDISRSLLSAGVIASTDPFVEAAKDEPAATRIQPGVYGLREHMSGASALSLLLDPSSRLFSRVTLPEGLRATDVLQKLSEATETPLADLQAAAADPAALGVPAGAPSVEGFLFPATYDFEPGTSAVDMLTTLVQRTEQSLTKLQVPQDQWLSTLTEASIVQAEASSTEDMGKVAQVLDNRIAIGMPLQLDTTVNYANGKSGLTTTAEERANDSPYNTYVHPGLPPGPIGNPGEDAISAVKDPTPGPWLFFVVVNPETGETRFAETAAEHQQNVLLFQQWLRDHPGG